MKTNWCKTVRLIIPHWNLPQVYSHNVKEKCIKFPAIPGNYLKIFLAAWSHQALQKNSSGLYISGKIYWLTARNLKVNEQSKYRSSPIFFIPSLIKRKPKTMEFLNFWACHINHKSNLRCENWHLKYQFSELSLDRPVQFLICKILYYSRNKFFKWNGL